MHTLQVQVLLVLLDWLWLQSLQGQRTKCTPDCPTQSEMEVDDVICAHTESNTETCSHSVSYVSAALQTLGTRYVFMKWENVRDRHVMKEMRESKREGLLFVPIMLLCCSRGHGESFQDPPSKSFLPLLLLSFLSPPKESILCPLPPSLQNNGLLH